MAENYSGVCAWFAPFLQKWTRIQRAFWPITHKTDDDWGEVWTPIGSPANRVTGPAPQHGVALRWADDSMTRCVDHLAFPLCASKQKGLAINSENRAKIYVVENNIVIRIIVAGQQKNAGGKNEGIFHYVIENTCIKNVRNKAFHYIDENKRDISSFPLC